MSLKLIFHIEILSDYHIGAGYGLGAGVDSALFRDADGVPGIRGTVLAGLLRDGLWRLMEYPVFAGQSMCQRSGKDTADEKYCGQKQPGNEVDLCPICRIFGTPKLPKRWFVRSARPLGKIEFTSKKEKSRTNSIQRARINPRTRRAEPHKLFSHENGAGDNTFTFTIFCPDSDESALDEAALMTAAARNVRELGHGRNRGLGNCRFNLVDVQGSDPRENWQAYLVKKRFPQKWLDGNKPAQRAAPNQKAELTRNTQDDDPVRVRLILRTDEPLLIAQRAEAGNQFESQGWISGQTLRGALAWQAARQYALGPEDPSYAVFVDTFLRGRVQFPNLYPANAILNSKLQMAVPAPRDLLTCKVAPGINGHGVWFTLKREEIQQCPKCASPLRSVDKFVFLQADRWQESGKFTLEPQTSTEMHIEINPSTRRVAEGQLYGYVVLDAGQYFVGELLCRNTGDWELLRELSGLKNGQSQTLRLGKASRRGYGKVSVWFEKIEVTDPHPWRIQLLSERVPQTKELILTLLTDTIILDPWGRHSAGFEKSWLQDVFGPTLVDFEHARVAGKLVDGFNAYFGLPRWRDMALTAGSTVKLIFDNEVDLQFLEEIEREGIGLRRNEGFGQVSFNHPVYRHCQGINYSLQLPQALHFGDHRDHYAQARSEWTKILGRQIWKPCKDARFTAVARWLHGNQRKKLERLQEKLPELGKPDSKLQKNITDYGERKKENKLQVQAKGIILIQNMLAELGKKDELFWPEGVAMLANHVAGAVDNDGKGVRDES